MRIIIAGCGKVGYTIAKHLSEDEDVTIIDINELSLERASESIDVMCVKGNALRATILNEASVSTADLIISVTSSDVINMLCCMTAKKLGVKHAIARIRDPEYAKELSMLKRDMGLDMVINPEFQAALEISRLIRFPSANEIDTFVHGRVELASFRVTESDRFAGNRIHQIFKGLNIPVLFGLVERDGEVIIPYGDLMIKTDDIIRTIGTPSAINDFFNEIGKYKIKIKTVFIVGGGKVTSYLIDILLKMHIQVKVIERDYEKCVSLNEMFPKILVIHGDGTDEDLLASERMKQADAVICLTDRDEENLMLALYALQCKVPKVIAKINTISYNGLIRNLGVESIICPKNITAYQIIRYVRALKNTIGNNVETLYKIVDGQDAEAIEFRVNESSLCCNKQLKALKLSADILIGAIVRGGRIIIPVGTDEILPGDNVIILSKGHSITDIDDILATN